MAANVGEEDSAFEDAEAHTCAFERHETKATVRAGPLDVTSTAESEKSRNPFCRFEAITISEASGAPPTSLFKSRDEPCFQRTSVALLVTATLGVCLGAIAVDALT
jgi:hypothetical protein